MKKREIWAHVVPHLIYLIAIGLILFYVGYAIDKNNQTTCDLYTFTYNAIKPEAIKDPEQRRVTTEYKVKIGKILDTYHCDK